MSGVHVRATGNLVEVGSVFSGYGIRTSSTLRYPRFSLWSNFYSRWAWFRTTPSVVVTSMSLSGSMSGRAIVSSIPRGTPQCRSPHVPSCETMEPEPNVPSRAMSLWCLALFSRVAVWSRRGAEILPRQ